MATRWVDMLLLEVGMTSRDLVRCDFQTLPSEPSNPEQVRCRHYHHVVARG